MAIISSIAAAAHGLTTGLAISSLNPSPEFKEKYNEELKKLKLPTIPTQYLAPEKVESLGNGLIDFLKAKK